jgi:hypothetical protein
MRRVPGRDERWVHVPATADKVEFEPGDAVRSERLGIVWVRLGNGKWLAVRFSGPLVGATYESMCGDREFVPGPQEWNDKVALTPEGE